MIYSPNTRKLVIVRHSCSFLLLLLMASALLEYCFSSHKSEATYSADTPSFISLLAHKTISWENGGQLAVISKKRGISARVILQSPNARYLFGFFSESSGIFTLSIYDLSYPIENESVIQRVWSAKTEAGTPCMLKENTVLQFEENGNLVLSHSDASNVWETLTSSMEILSMNLLDTGNLGLYNSAQQPVWESFKFPVDTMLPGQILSPGMKLINGIYTLKMEVGGLVLYSGSSVKWFWSFYNVGDLTDVLYTCKRPTYAEFTEKGLHLSQDANIVTRTISEDLLNYSVKSIDPIVLSDGYKAAGLRLSCYGAVHIDVQCPKPDKWKSRKLLGMKYLMFLAQKTRGKRPISTSSSEAGRTLLSISEQPEQERLAEKKETALPPTQAVSTQKQEPNQRKRKAVISITVLLSATALALCGGICIQKKLRKKPTPVKTESSASIKDIVPQAGPAKFSFKQVRKITNNFSVKLGDGGFGLVYEGTLKDGSKVAVKMLERTSTQGEKEFKAEVSVMATVRHLNLIRLRGYCAQGPRRILIYDFMPNSSLDKWLFITPGKDCMLDWSRRYSIALGTARGLAYLHEECSQKIIHLDVKPENILLDQNFLPKVSDFGLAKLMDRDKSRVVTNMRGTPGYLAPEWLHGTAVTAKADVYSFGMVLLELICGRETIDLSKGSEQWYLPAWAVRMVEEGRPMELIDEQLHEEVEYFYEDQAKRSIRVALCCIQEDPTQRPTMGRVVQMLDGLVEPRVPQLSKLNVQPSCATTRVKDKLVAFAEALADERSASELMGGPRISDKDIPSWGVKGGLGSIVGSARTVLKARNVPCIPPWPLKGDIVIVRGSGTGEFTHAVVRDVKIRTQQVKLAVLQRVSSGDVAEEEALDSSNKWVVLDEETVWRQWNVLVRTLEFWVPVNWSTLPGSGPQKYPIEWIAN
ncbi:G-type lectin S-receptor-like serine/threonine-protein kinase SD2-5 [Selaginella moellendorffii]|uniref:G-type lectin S-receptor-like serine/threonine-protein kinase SD2-5 n=1 Tax=Selaginella moellendorffii TaxID=88036 RepID=UPI000D1CAD8E|nr:G-type lectin S-receptor-like serine/threonine-protein kinase SD2-5 [Selaginella moellendorffii]|eukprot:XP_024540838.1 G-type lectin S-receptor-like serine/threonine-protein kinase SD2-5 [Selaginella moellendorffii]